MKFDISRAWKDDAYRQSLDAEQLKQLPPNPAGELVLTDTDLASLYGGDDGQGGSFNRVKISSICSIECSVDCNIRMLNILGLL
jgi:mersacidin/lichenicidin family type 2 lantibiotic